MLEMVLKQFREIFSNWNAETGVLTAMNINTVELIMLLILSLVQDYLWNYYCCRE
jgi:hypothetical protein